MFAEENIPKENNSNLDQPQPLKELPKEQILPKSTEEQNSINNKTQNELKLGQYMLTPLMAILLNKLMPEGFKFETEENVLKSIDASKNQAKRSKPSVKYGDSSRRNKVPKKGQVMDGEGPMEPTSSKRKKIQSSDKNFVGGDNPIMTNVKVNPELYKLMMKCKKGLEKIKSNANSEFFYTCGQQGEPSLAYIEKKVNAYQYQTFYDFSMDLRKLWSHFFQNYPKNPEIYQKTCKMSEISENVCKELENNSEEIVEDISKIKKRTEKLRKDIDDYKDHGNHYGNNTMPAPVKKVSNQNNDNKTMSFEEKNQLGNAIRSLSKMQLRGIINILQDPNSENNGPHSNKYFEFDIDKLPPKKLRELERYVKGCLDGTINPGNTYNNNSNNQTKGHNNNNTSNINNDHTRNNNNRNIQNNNQRQQQSANNLNNHNLNNARQNENISNINNNRNINEASINNNKMIGDSNNNLQKSNNKAKKQPSGQKKMNEKEDDSSESESSDESDISLED